MQMGEASMKSIRRLEQFFSDSLWSIAGLMLMNIVAQFCVYPIWSAKMGSESYGNVVSLLAIMNIWAVPMGYAANCALLVSYKEIPKCVACCNGCMAIGAVVAFPYGILAGRLSGLSFQESVLFALLASVTTWRYYADVEYRLTLNFKGYFCYYLIISIGYGVGIGAFLLTGLWPLALLVGELAGCIFTGAKGTVLRQGFTLRGEGIHQFANILGTLLATNIITNLIFNGDRIVLRLLINGTAVTIYYLASLLGKTATLVTTPLNSVIISYLARYDGRLTMKLMHIITVLLLSMTVIGTGLCILASHILIPILYPAEYLTCVPYFLIGNVTQVLYFTGGMMGTVLLRFEKASYQSYMTAVYAVLFLLLCIPGIIFAGFNGFCIGLAITCVLRFIYSVGLGYWSAKRTENVS